MPKINFNDYKKLGEDPETNEGYTVSEIQTKDRQFLIKEEGIIFDIIDLDFDGKGPGMEILMSLIGEDFKMRCDIVPKEIFDTYDIPDYLISLVEEYKPCLECKTKILEGLCSLEEEEGDGEIEFILDDEEDEDEKA